MKNEPQPESASENLHIIDPDAIGRSVRRHKFGALIILLSVVALASLYTAIKTPIYRVRASVLIENRSQSIVANADAGVVLTREVTEAQRVLASTEPVLQRALDIAQAKRPGDQGLQIPDAVEKLFYPLDVSVEGQLLILYCFNPDSGRATDLANSWMLAFIEEMTLRERSTSKYTAQFLDEEVPKLREKWYSDQVKLQGYLDKTKYDPKEWERNPIRQRYADLGQLLTAARTRTLAQSEEVDKMARLKDDPAQLLQLPRARKDTAILNYERMIQEEQRKLLDVRAQYGNDSVAMKEETALLQELETLRREALEAVAGQMQLEKSLSEDEVAGLSKQYDAAKEEFEALSLKASEYQRLAFTAEMSKRQYEDMLGRLNNASLSGRVEYSYAKTWEHGKVPDKPYSPKWPINLSLGVVIGLLLAAGFIYLREVTDGSVHSDAQLQEKLGVNVMGSVPLLDTANSKGCYHLVERHPRMLASEHLRSLRMGLLLACPDAKSLVVLVTSAGQSDGKTFISSNLGVAFSVHGKKTLLVDADPYKGTLTSVWKNGANLESSPHVPASSPLLADADPAGIANLFVLPVGGHYKNPSAVWQAPGTTRLLQEAREQYEVVIIDSPPLLAVADAQILAQLCDITLVVVRSRMTQFVNVHRTIDILQRARARQTSFVVNGLDYSDAEAAGYGYHHGYGRRYGYGYGYGYGQKGREREESSEAIGKSGSSGRST
jgi:capsular exopolysaccharide synthesis family protein